MKIISTFLHPVDWEEHGCEAPLMAFDTLINDKSVVVGIIVGSMIGPTLEDAHVSAPDLQVVRRVIEHHQFIHPKAAPIIVAPMKDVDVAKTGLLELLRHAPHQSALVLLCANEMVYEAALPLLCVNFQSPNTIAMQ